MICSIEGCKSTARKVTGLCRSHYMKEYQAKNSEKRAAYAKKYHAEYYKKNKDKILEKNKNWFKENPGKRNEMYKSWCAKNPEKYKARNKKLREQNKEYYRAYHSAKKRKVRDATPDWVDTKELVRIYENRPAGCHVDHIIPINGKGVCGLHVPWNLQYLPAKDNIRKGNKY